MAIYVVDFMDGKQVKKSILVEADNYFSAIAKVLTTCETDCSLYDLVMSPTRKYETIK